MRIWFGHVRGAVLLALAWGLAWAPLGILAGIIIDSDGVMDEPWIAIGAYPGFLCALIFSVVLVFTDRRRGLAELSSARAAGWGALSGLVLTVPLVTGFVGEPNAVHVLWRGRFLIVGAVTLLSVLSAAASVWVAGKARGHEVGDRGVRTA